MKISSFSPTTTETLHVVLRSFLCHCQPEQIYSLNQPLSLTLSDIIDTSSGNISSVKMASERRKSVLVGGSSSMEIMSAKFKEKSEKKELKKKAVEEDHRKKLEEVKICCNKIYILF